MDNSTNDSIAVIQQKYKDCNLLLPVSTEAQINPFYRLTVMEVKADLSDNSGDVFKVGSVKVGDSWVDTYSPAKPLLMKLAAAAGIQFDPSNTYGTKVSQNCYKAKAFGAMRLPDGAGKTHCDEKVIDLDDAENQYRIEFMDKSITGIVDEKAAKEAAKMFSGEWIEAENKYGKPCKAYRIADSDRQTYIDRSVMVNMSLLRKTAAEKAMTGAILRVVRALIGMKGQYTKAELTKPFAVPRVTFSPDYSNPDVRRAMLAQGMNSVSNMFGSSPMISGPMHEEGLPVVDDEFDPDEFADNPAFTSEIPDNAIEGDYDVYIEPPETPTPDSPPKGGGEVLECGNCGNSITATVSEFSTTRYGLPLCMKCQKEFQHEDESA